MINENQTNPYAIGSTGPIVIDAEDSQRLTFIRRTYAHLAGAIVALVALETLLFAVVPAQTMNSLVERMLSGWGWLIVLGAFMGVSWIAEQWARSDTSRSTQYAGLSLYVVAQAVILLPLLYIALRFDPQIPVMAAMITVVTFVGLTVFVMTTKVDLAGWGKYLGLAGILALGLIVAGILFGFSLGLWFSAGYDRAGLWLHPV